MPSPFDRDHHRIDEFATAKAYKRPNQGPRDGIERETRQHAEDLKRDLAAAWAATTDLVLARDAEPSGEPGRYLDFDTQPYSVLPDLNWVSKGIMGTMGSGCVHLLRQRSEGHTSIFQIGYDRQKVGQ